jgi:hypothetical protein
VAGIAIVVATAAKAHTIARIEIVIQSSQYRAFCPASYLSCYHTTYSIRQDFLRVSTQSGALAEISLNNGRICHPGHHMTRGLPWRAGFCVWCASQQAPVPACFVERRDPE